MTSVNRVILIGHLGGDPESRLFSDGSSICNIRVATTNRWRDKATGALKESTEWHRVVLYRRLAEVGSKYLRKGAKVYIEGRLCTRKWADSNGVERQTTEIEATNMLMLGEPVGVDSEVVHSKSVTRTHENYLLTPKSYSTTPGKELETDFDDPPF